MKFLIPLAVVALAVQLFATPILQFLADAAGLAGFVAWSWWDGLARRE